MLFSRSFVLASKSIPLHFQILIGMIAGVLFGYLLPDQISWVAPFGTIFIRLLKMIVVPLIFISIMNGIVSVGSAQKLSQLGAKSVAYYLTTTSLATITGLILVNWIQPG